MIMMIGHRLPSIDLAYIVHPRTASITGRGSATNARSLPRTRAMAIS